MDVRGLPIGPSGAVITVGTFDGVHRGHQDVLRRVALRAEESGKTSVVVTFEPHPLQILRPEQAPQLLTTFREKLEIIASTGVSYVAVLPFTPALAALDAAAFVDDVLRARFGLSELMVGHDHGFGRGRLGDINALRRLGEERGFTVIELAPVIGNDGSAVSSSVIRRAIAGGDLGQAAAGLGRPYYISGRVMPGDGRGRALGYRTLNLEAPQAEKMLPPNGVYAVQVHTPEGAHGGMMNLGPRPTFGDESRQIEAHVFDANRDWYGTLVRIDLLGWLRGTQTFADATALVAQLRLDEAAARHLLKAVAD
jgi:riboflavin kinase / FMN adenylyltransferase